MPQVVHIILHERSYPVLCAPAGIDLKPYDFCVITGHEDLPEETGYVHGFTSRCEQQLKDKNIPRVIRKATSREVRAWHFLQRRESEALAICKEKASRHKLDMRISSVKFDDRQRKVIFNFTADKRVDFRELVKDLAAAFHARIELWQIGVRDETRQLGGMSTCGRHLCCASWLKDFIPVSIRYAKVQDIPFSPPKLSGICGRLRCCLAYEQAQYAELGKGVPAIGAIVRTEEHGEARVIDRNLLVQTLSIQDEKGHTHIIPVTEARQIKDAEGGVTETWTDAAPIEIESIIANEEREIVPEVRMRNSQPAAAKKQQSSFNAQRPSWKDRKEKKETAVAAPATQPKPIEQESDDSTAAPSEPSDPARKRRRRRRPGNRAADEGQQGAENKNMPSAGSEEKPRSESAESEKPARPERQRERFQRRRPDAGSLDKTRETQ
jgi:cell fate regulator YaaT (PSP1 superfamily)